MNIFKLPKAYYVRSRSKFAEITTCVSIFSSLTLFNILKLKLFDMLLFIDYHTVGCLITRYRYTYRHLSFISFSGEPLAVSLYRTLICRKKVWEF